MREKGDKFWVSIFALQKSSNDALFGLDHLWNKCGESSLVFGSFKRQYDVYSSNELVSRYTWLISKAEHFKLALNISVDGHAYLVRFHWAAIFFVFFHSLIVRLLLLWGDLTLQDCLILWGNRYQLLAIKVCFSLLVGRNLFLLSIIDLSICSLQTDSCCIRRIVFIGDFAEPFERRESLLTGTRVDLNTELQVFGQVKGAPVPCARHHFSFFELLANFHGDTCRENGSLNSGD